MAKHQNLCIIPWRGLYWLPQGALAASADVTALFDVAFPTDGAAVAFCWINHF